ncbi:unnamed protein product [Cylindrotheca closterium]|uniref:BZIP domain-containing protein n=1 Tax=Cylindrotheca closterium TaxID=2856 RepID=A0AAD2CBE2_9STRA|nr:unnamed protein product [Cylindrotheca closterium]
MDQQQSQHGGRAPAPIAPNPNATNPQQMDTMGAQGLTPQHLLELMTNPSLAAAAAASPLLPPAAMMTNPGAVYTMPDVFTSSAGLTPRGATSGIPLQHLNAQTGVPMSNQQFYQYQLGQQAAQMQALSSGGYQLQAGMGGQMAMMAAPPNHAASSGESNGTGDSKKGKRKRDFSPAERARRNRDRNREHAKSTRLRKKAYIQELKELVEGMQAERTEEVRQRRVAIQRLADMQNVRRQVIHNFLRFLCNSERDKRKWSTILEDDFWLKQPVTPYRCFRRSEIEKESRISRGLDAIVADAASVAVMIEGVGSRSTRWMNFKRREFFLREEERTGRKRMPRSIQNGKFQHAVSSLSASSSNSSNTGSSCEEASKKGFPNPSNGVKKVSNSSGSSDSGGQQGNHAGEFHDYHAKPLPDPKLADSERSSSNETSEDSPAEDSNGSADDTKRVSTDSSSGDDSTAAIKDPRPPKRRKHVPQQTQFPTNSATLTSIALKSHLPHNIAKTGGISHNVRAMFSSGVPSVSTENPLQSNSPAIALPPFAGIGKKSPTSIEGSQAREMLPPIPNADASVAASASGSAAGTHNGPAIIISGDVETSSSNSSSNRPHTRACFHINEDNIILMDDILMAPYVMRTQDAVQCGALAECVMTGMLRAHFSNTSKLKSIELIYDAMGFMQQLERASGNETTAQIIPGSLEMALSPNAQEARVITLAQKPYKIVNVNESWTKLTRYTQMEAEGKELFKILEGDLEADAGELSNVPYELDDVSQGQCTCATRLHFDKEGREFVDFICSYPLTNANDEITHMLHVSKELPEESSVDVQESSVLA